MRKNRGRPLNNQLKNIVSHIIKKHKSLRDRYKARRLSSRKSKKINIKAFKVKVIMMTTNLMNQMNSNKEIMI